MYNILIVDDSSIERKGIRMIIERRGENHRVFEACNGEEAWDFVRNYPVNIMFTDVRMPIMDGIELLGRVKQFNPDIQAIIFSAYGDFEYTSKAIENKANHYLLKPINVADFNRAMDTAIEVLDKITINSNQENEIVENFVRFDARYQRFEGDDVTAGVMEAMSVRQFERLEPLVADMFGELGKRNALSMLFVKQMVIEILKKLYEYVADEYQGEIYQTVNRIIMMKSVEELEKGTLSIIREVCEKIGEGADRKKISSVIKRALDRIHQSYSEDISLDTVAEEVSLTPKYFGKIFKQEIGTGFVKYLTNYRLEKAARILVKTNKNIAEVCKLVGIQDSSYFCLIFKKKYDKSPEQYRKEANGR